ncbi:type II secretion system protein GspJ [Litorimonas cladophorae]|uniref:Type II secretion system protein J n=1 Tax=Litorimonas cladophorae TaxID=1220491 RepID=A0A918NFK4_9PROT|nr:type II secretion system protein GspJ [Litorimonas cladophorae]GGX69288.1 type II secretion system protein GspJ [Litorimonas cladophorae]
MRRDRLESNSEAGFTLVEVLVSLFIFAVISAGTMTAMMQTFAAKDRLDQAATELSDLAAFRSILRADMAALDLRPARDGFGGREQTLVTTDGDALLTFTRLGRSNTLGAKRGQAERVRYLFRDGQFIRESLPHENPAELGLWRGRVILEGLQNAELTYLTRTANVDLELQNWTIPNPPAARPVLTTSAVELLITDRRGNVTAHLFELGL